MRLRVLVIAIYVAVVLCMILWAISDHLFSDNIKPKQLRNRLLLSIIWPLALFSRGGRKILFNNAREL